MIGASDAGAHLDMIDAFAYTTDVLGPSVRSRKLFSLEEAVQLITDVPARAYGFAGRGQIAVGNHADLVVFDPDRIGPGDIHLRDDLPGQASRLYMVADGVDSVFVAGNEVVHGQELTGRRSGAVLSSGKDTTTVHADHLADENLPVIRRRMGNVGKELTGTEAMLAESARWRQKRYA